jgi:hypothetical protein
MRSVRLHAALLALAVVAAFLTWTRETPSMQERQRPLVWERDTADVRSLLYESDLRNVEITRRVEGEDVFLWGLEVVRPTDASSSPPDTLSYPVGEPGSAVVNGFAELRVIREIGPVPPDRAADFGLDEPGARVTVSFADDRVVLAVGSAVYGGSDRYARNEVSGDVYVLPAGLVGPLRTGSGALRERRLHYFADGDVAQVRVQARGRERVMTRRASEGAGPAAWGPVDDPIQTDLTFANFMERVGQLGISGFEGSTPEEALERVVRIEYSDGDARPLGFLELYRHLGDDGYSLRTERTRIRADAIALLAERVEEGLGDVF